MLTRSIGSVLILAGVALTLVLARPAVEAQAFAKRITETPIADAPSFAKYALVIGVSDYDSCAQLPACTNDAKDFAALLKSKYGFDNVVLMTDDPASEPRLRPTEAHIFKALKVMFGGILKNKSEVVYYFSGHGTRAKDPAGNDADFLVPEDADPNDIADTCVSYDHVKAKLDTLQPRRLLLITDACRDLLGNKSVASSGFGKGINQVTLGPEVAELESCLPTETSLVGEPADFNESVFTHLLIKGLAGDPEAVNA